MSSDYVYDVKDIKTEKHDGKMHRSKLFLSMDIFLREILVSE